MRTSFISKNFFLLLFFFSITFIPVAKLQAWTEHTLISYPFLAAMPELRNAKPVKVENLNDFLMAEGKKLELFLMEQESWAKKNLQWYMPLSPSLKFKAANTSEETRLRFCSAIRVNPKMLFQLYLQLIPGEDTSGRSSLSTPDITFLQDKSDLKSSNFVRLHEGEMVKPLDVISSATNEPDLGLDIGLFEDNNTDFGKIYGFGIQPFGNPNLEFGSQAPFHMGFYHEAKIIYYFAGFLKKTYPEYRIHLYKKLSEFAFQTGHVYWGWRFAGWGLHYLADLTQPYHATVLPGVGTMKALWINTMDLLGIHSPKTDAVQLVSNRHLSLEKFQQVILQRAYRENQQNNPILIALQSAKNPPVYDDSMPREIISKAANAKAAQTDKALMNYMPMQFVSDPKFEFGTSKEQFQIVEKIKTEKGQQAIEKLTILTAELLTPLAAYGQSYLQSIQNNAVKDIK